MDKIKLRDGMLFTTAGVLVALGVLCVMMCAEMLTMWCC
jgi:hypothetical protein